MDQGNHGRGLWVFRDKGSGGGVGEGRDFVQRWGGRGYGWCVMLKTAQILTFQELCANSSSVHICTDFCHGQQTQHTHCLRTDHSHALTADCCRDTDVPQVETSTEQADTFVCLFCLFVWLFVWLDAHGGKNCNVLVWGSQMAQKQLLGQITGSRIISVGE